MNIEDATNLVRENARLRADIELLHTCVSPTIDWLVELLRLGGDMTKASPEQLEAAMLVLRQGLRATKHWTETKPPTNLQEQT